ncbi:hypothetical protein [Nocardia acidivorans]|uniref:hypothetical protein n=1 Tax=Nocardia acidivorans TaxID=404580 RepID=UPI00157DDDB2|nr:hypothetical protein [Nocardia acidivorans]
MGPPRSSVALAWIFASADISVPGTGMDHTEHAVAAARTAGVERIVLISSFWAIGDPRE